MLDGGKFMGLHVRDGDNDIQHVRNLFSVMGPFTLVCQL